MSLIRPVRIWSFLLLIFRALIVQTVQDRKLLLPSQSSSFDSLNQTSLPSDISANKPAVLCDGHEYGINLIAADCRDAITGIKRSTQRLSFRERSADPQTWDVGLPSRQIGGKDGAMGIPSITAFRSDFKAVQGLCTVELEFKPGSSSAIATSLDVYQAAVAVFRICVTGPRSNTGGLAIDIGEYMNE